MQTLETSDIFRGASLICLGATLSGVRRECGSVNFTFQGESLDSHDMDYRIGRALVNPLQLRETLNLLRDLIFQPTERKRKEISHANYR